MQTQDINRLIDNISICMESQVKGIIEKIWIDRAVEEFVQEIKPKIEEKLKELTFDTIERYYSATYMKDNLNIHFKLGGK
jgi:hypothetical protein